MCQFFLVLHSPHSGKKGAPFFFCLGKLYPRMVNDSTRLEKIQDGELRFAPRAGDPDVSCQLPKGLNLRSKNFPTQFFRDKFFFLNPQNGPKTLQGFLVDLVKLVL